MKNIYFPSLLLICLAFVACATQSGVVQERASYDLKCPEEKIDVKEIGGTSYAAEGCGRSETYTCTGGDLAHVNASCWPDRSNSHPVAESGSSMNPAMMAPNIPPPAPMPMH